MASNDMYLTLGHVGIGTTSPQYTLHVANASSPTNFNLGVNNISGSYTNLYMSLSAVSGGYASIQAVQSSGSAYGSLALNGSGGNFCRTRRRRSLTERLAILSATVPTAMAMPTAKSDIPPTAFTLDLLITAFCFIKQKRHIRFKCLF